MMNGKKILDKAKAIAAEHEQKKIDREEARSEAIAAEKERQRIEKENQIAECKKNIVASAKAISAEYDISFMEALEVIKMVDTYFDNNLKDIVYYLKDIASSISYLSLK